MSQSEAHTSQNATSTRTPYRQIRARQPTPDTIIVYQAYSTLIAEAAVAQQRLSASHRFSMTRMTWIKPSFFWCMYRSGWSYKDNNQARILQITVKRDGFISLLREAAPSWGPTVEKNRPVRYQWDPERSIKLGRLNHRSLQLGISGEMMERWIDEWIVNIEDITDDVRRWKDMLDNGDDDAVESVKKDIDETLGEELIFDIGDDQLEVNLQMQALAE
ncbi:hypothetical protein CPB86DRAFT_840946 [Serendipita vermifera]|nr:hypothetical protein CPB86DRAFT_840946 [Serendipita vermifera]